MHPQDAGMCSVEVCVQPPPLSTSRERDIYKTAGPDEMKMFSCDFVCSCYLPGSKNKKALVAY